MKKKNVVIAAICTAAVAVGTWLSIRKRNRNQITNNDNSYAPLPQPWGETGDQPVYVPSTVESQGTDLNEHTQQQIEDIGEDESHREANSPFFKEAIRLALIEDPNAEKRGEFVDNSYYFHHSKLSTWLSSLHPIFRIIPCNRFDENRKEKIRGRRLDILFPVPQSLVMEGIDMGIYTEYSGLTTLPGDTGKINARDFHLSFGSNRKAGDKSTEYMGFIPRFVASLVPYYPLKDVEVRKEGYFIVSYLVYDQLSRKFVRQHKLYCGTDSDRLKDRLASINKNEKNRDSVINDYLIEITEKFYLSEEVEEIPTDVIDPVRLERKKSIAVDETEIDDVFLAYRVSFFLADDETYPIGITPYGVSKILYNLFIKKIDICKNYSDSDDERYRYSKPWIIEEFPDRYGELNVLTLVDDEDEDNLSFESIPLVSRETDRLVEEEVNNKLLKEKK
jgi:hypothetical protein